MKTFNIKLFYTYKLMSQCLPIYAFYTILFIERGMSVSDIAVLMAIWSIFTIIFEIPSGVLSDRWNRKGMLAIAALMQGLCFVIWFFSYALWMFAVGFVFWAAAGAFTSGTEEGLIYDNLKSDGQEHEFGKIYGRGRFYENIGMVFGIVSSGLIAGFIEVEIIALLSAAICVFNAVLVLQLREKNYYARRLDKESIGFGDTLSEAFVFIKSSRAVLITILLLVLFINFGNYLDEFDALIINDFGLSKYWVSIILTIRFVFTALGDVLAALVRKRISSLRQVLIIYGAACIFLLTFAIIWKQHMILMFGFSLMMMAVTEILLVDVLQSKIKEEGRATVMSFYGVGQNVVMICFSLVYALLAEVLTLQQVYVIIAIYGIVGGCSSYVVLKLRRAYSKK